MKNRFPLLFVGLAAFGAGHLARTDDASQALDLAALRAALDSFGSGRAPDALLTLENASNGRAMPAESAWFLAYLQEKAGRAPQARATLERLENPSPLAREFLNRLGAPLQIDVAAKKTAPLRRSAPDGPARLSSTDARIVKLEREMLTLINAERTRAGLRALSWDDDMAATSRAHSAEMRDRKYFAHESPNRALKDPLDRYIAGVGFTPRLVGENVYRAWGSRPSLNEAGMRSGHKSLMESPGHRANILLAGATRAGIGIVSNAAGDIWITQMFARP